MNNLKWEEGKTYRFKPDMIEEFKRNCGSNPRIARILGGNTFTVGSVSKSALRVLSLLGYCNDDIELEYWFTESEIKYFDLVEDTRVGLPNMNSTNNIRPVDDIIAEWLDKLQYVIENDNTVGYGLMLDSEDVLTLSTDFGDIIGSYGIYNIITNRYDLLQQEAKHKKNNDLMERKAELEAELAEVNKELNNV